MADGRHINNRFGHQPDFSEILCKEEVFHRISVIVDTAVPQNVFFVFLMQFGLRQAAPYVLSRIHLL